MAKQGKPTSQPSTHSSLPQNWPSSLPYLTTPSYSPSITKSHFTALRTPPPPPDTLPEFPLPRGPSPSVRITPIANPLHPAHTQCGLFASRDLRPGELVVPYLGEVHSGAAADPKSDYDLWLDREGDVAVDAARMGNEARFVNDYRGVPGAKRPNAEFRDVWWSDLGEKGMAVFVLPAGKRTVGRARTVGVGKGEEILVSYGKGFWGGRREEDGAEEGVGDEGRGQLQPDV